MPDCQVERVYVVVNFLFQVIFVFLLFLGIVIYANEVETKEKEKLPEIKNKPRHLYSFLKLFEGRHLIFIGFASQVCDATTLNLAKP